MTDQAQRPKARRARGLQDRRGAPLARERDIIAKVSRVYEAWGFEQLDTAAFEYADALGKFLPDQDRPNEGVFAFQDDDEQWLAMRYDLTAPLARFVAENFDALPKPYRRWAAGPVWRNEKPGPGRFREFWQCDADTVGAASPAADAEMIAMACAALEAAGVRRGGYQLRFSTRKLLDAVLASIGVSPQAYAVRLTVLRAIDKYDRLGVEGVEALLGAGRKDESGDFTKGAGLDGGQRATIMKLVTSGADNRASVLARLANVGGDAADELRAIDEALVALGVDDTQAAIDPTIVRGLEYYTGAVFEAQLIEGEAALGSVGGGGRYDDLVARFRGERIPATGFSIGVSRLAAALQAQEEAESEGPVVVLVMDQTRVSDALAMAAQLREAGIRAEAYLGGGGMKAQLKYADKRAAPIAVIQGGDELAKGVVTLKDLKLGARIAAGLGEDREAYAKAREQVQVEAPRAEIVAAVQQILHRV
ncbi:MAG: histidine--tRNA ligase [Hyphomonadaceae bacterium]|nr:histidine--tRNA ligase [Hyphomonadaceae bacterium]